MKDRIYFFNEDNENTFKRILDESIDCVCIDPPYKYLKNQKLEVDFKEDLFFTNCNRVLKKGGFVILFGRGASFYRWNTMLDNLGFIFKEEVIWNKGYCTSPLMDISRVHETISIWCKGKGKINKIKIPYLETKANDIDAIIVDIKRLKAVFKNTESLNAVIDYLETNKIREVDRKELSTTVSSKIHGADRCASVMAAINEGMNEKTIIKEVRNHYSSIHPTEKPVRLIERLLALVCKKGDVVADFFAGSGSAIEAGVNMDLTVWASEIDKEYFDLAKKRIEGKLSKSDLFTSKPEN